MNRILVISELYWPEKGGAELATHLILKILRKKSAITVLTGTKSPCCLEGVRYICCSLLNVSNKLQLWKNLYVLMASDWFKRLLDQSDTVYIPRYSYPIIHMAKQNGKKVIIHLHNYQLITYCSLVLDSQYQPSFLGELQHSTRYEILENGSPRKALLSSLMSPSNRLVVNWSAEADAIICVSKKQKDIIASTMPDIGHKLQVIHNPLPHTPLVKKRLSESSRFAYIGGDSYAKGFYFFLSASQRFLTRNAQASFMLAGHISTSNMLLISTTKGTYDLLGHINHKDVLQLYASCKALFFPSITEEPLPYAVLESMLSGTLPVVSQVGGIPEIVQGTKAEALMFLPGDVDGSVEKLEDVLSLSEESLQEIGEDLRSNILQRFDQDDVNREFLHVFS